MKMTRVRRSAFAIAVGALIAAFSGLGQTALAQNTYSYTYDALGRISTVTYPNGAVVTYTYDAAGNRTARSVVGTTWGQFTWGSAKW